MTLKTTLKTKTNPFTPNLPNQKYQRETTKPNIPNQTYQTKLTKPNLPNQTYHTKSTKPSLPNKTCQTQPNIPNQSNKVKITKIKLISHIDESKPCQSIKTNKDLIRARQVKACPELVTAQLQLVLYFLIEFNFFLSNSLIFFNFFYYISYHIKFLDTMFKLNLDYADSWQYGRLRRGIIKRKQKFG